MNKIITSIFLSLLLYSWANAQNENVGIGTNSPDNSAVLHVGFDAISGPKGLIIPRMTTVQRSSIPTPLANGLLIFNTDSNQFEFYNSAGLNWLPLLSTGNLTLNSGNLFIGNASNLATGVAMSGDALINNTGVLAIQDNAVDGSDISVVGEANGSIMYNDGVDWINLSAGNNGEILAINAGVPVWQADNSISTTLNSGNIIVGDATNTATKLAMNGDILITETGLTTIQDAAVDGRDISLTGEATGSINYFDGTEWVSLAVGTDGQFLSLASGIPVWADVAGASGTLDDAYTNGSTIALTLAGGSVAISGSLDADAALELSNTGTNGIGLQVNNGLSRFGNSYTATVASGDGDLIVDNVLEVGADIYIPNMQIAPNSNNVPLVIDNPTGIIYREVSSRRYKDHITDYNFNYNIIMDASVKEYTIKGSNATQIGLIAEELDSLGLKYLVAYNKKGQPDAVHYSKVSLYLLEVVKQQQKEIESMKKDIEYLKSKVK